jgi:hypothetical protein
MPEIVGRLRTPRLASAPAAPVVGEMYYDTTTNILYWWNGTAWTSASGGAAGCTKYMYTFSTLTGTPNSQEIRLDAAVYTATKFRAHLTSLTALTMYDLESHAKPGSVLLLANGNRTYSLLRVTTSLLPGGPYLELGVTYLGGGDFNDVGAGTISVEVIPGYAIPTGGTTGQVLTKTSATNYAAAWQAAGGAMDLRYNGSWAAGTYTDGDIVILNGVSYMAVRTTTQTPAPWNPPTPLAISPISYNTVLPTVPYDGQEAILVDSITNPSYQWRFRYNAGSSSAYKWEFVGGVPMFSEAPSMFSVAVATYTVAGDGPSIALPRSGDYDVEIGCWVQQSVAANAAHYMSYTIGGTAAVDADGIHVDQWDAVTPRVFPHISRPRRKTGLGAVTLAAAFRAGSGQTGFQSRWMRVTPVRVS